MRPAVPLLVLAVLTAAPAVRAQEDAPPLRPEKLYLHEGVLLGSTRMVGLGGAYVGIAEGAEGSIGNLAALAHRDPRLERDWDLDATLSWLDVPLASARNRDLDNDGLPDDARDTFQFLMGLSLQIQRFGAGFSLNTRRVTYCATVACDGSDAIQVSLTHTAFGGAVALGQDDVLVGVGLEAVQAVFSQGGEDWSYGGSAWVADVLVRPHDTAFRVGATLRPPVVARWQRAPGQAPVLAGRQLYSAVVSPGVLSLGMSLRLGEGAERYNRLSPAARRQSLGAAALSAPPPEDSVDGPAGRWLLAAQLDVVRGEDNAVPVRSFTSLAGPVPVGDGLRLQPRVGVEHETLPGRLRTRVGSFLEPSPFGGKAPRPHVTGGFELFTFRYLQDWAVSASFDVARRYSNFGVSVGFWR